MSKVDVHSTTQAIQLDCEQNNKNMKKRLHKRKKDDPDILIEQKMQSKEMADANNKHTKKMHHKRKRDPPLEDALIEHKLQKEIVDDNRKLEITSHHKQKRNASGGNDNGKKIVRFSSDVEILHSTKNCSMEQRSHDGLVCGKRYTAEEDQIIKDACFKYIEDNNLEDGLNMILYPRNHPTVRGCWKEIGASIPWRKPTSVFERASYILCDRKRNRKWTREEIEFILSYVNKHGRRFLELAKHFNVHRHQVKDTWRRNRLPNPKKGYMSQDEYQEFFELVNEDLKMKVFEEKKDNGMIRENICWNAISDKMTTRYAPDLCNNWYRTLTSAMVSQGLWSSCDDYRLLFKLSKLDACCFEDVDWDNLIANRAGDVCRKRWMEMTRQIGGNFEKTFMEQVELLSSRYSIDMLKYRKLSLSEPDSESEVSESDMESRPDESPEVSESDMEPRPDESPVLKF